MMRWRKKGGMRQKVRRGSEDTIYITFQEKTTKRGEGTAVGTNGEDAEIVIVV